jgi:hypothetical protein
VIRFFFVCFVVFVVEICDGYSFLSATSGSTAADGERRDRGVTRVPNQQAQSGTQVLGDRHAGAPSGRASVEVQPCAGEVDSTPAGAGSHLAEKMRTHQIERSAARP